MQGVLYEEASFGVFLFVTLVLGGLGAWMTGRACALTWRPLGSLLVYLVILACAVRFIHFSLFGGTLIAPQYFVVDLVILLVIGIAGYRFTRTNQMVDQYYWLYERSGPFSWRDKQIVA
ncbi:DUF6867 family protein [Prosthecomicrobium pneumaticum]|uniref:DUF6867 domain-containing protein n=1 Tax=Prosthecomicrobium pneumaticum TaxID=81895 RepID=A0A7W9FPI0_9HYPH|nr:hypothetical protein [Prosthecomicrobium pneumaticum]MBB5754504.1 hypothetical protein [Prosthecomicrobium pneumaticum]